MVALLAGCDGTGGNSASNDLAASDGVPGEIQEVVADTNVGVEPLDLGPEPDWTGLECQLEADEDVDSLSTLGCPADYDAMSTRPLQTSVASARSLKTIVDQSDSDAVYFLNANKYAIHYTFASTFLSGSGKPVVPDQASFTSSEYYSPYRRFLLGSLTYYESLKIYAYEIAPYDTSSAEMITKAFDLLANSSFCGERMVFHPTSDSVGKVAADLPERIRVVTTEQLMAGASFVPFNLGVGIGQLRRVNVSQLESEQVFVSPRELVVLDRVPNDIAVVAGIITGQMQTPLSHINVLSQNRGTPNMYLPSAMKSKELEALEGKWVKLEVTAFQWTVTEVTKEEADAWWELHKPPQVVVADLDLSVTELTDCADLGIDDIPAFGGKASHFGALTRIGGVVRVPKAFAIPVYYYKKFESINGFDTRIDEMLADSKFENEPLYRQAKLAELQDDMRVAPLPEGLEEALLKKLADDYPGIPMRFRSSTNAEDLDGFTGAGLYSSTGGDPGDPNKPVANAVRYVWSALWNYRAFEERSWRGIDHKGVAMAILVHRSFPAEDSQGVALTNNMFDEVEPAFYINAQLGDTQVVNPPAGTTADQFLYYYYNQNQPMTFYAHSNLVPEGTTVLTRAQTYELGQALEAIHYAFKADYWRAGQFYAMDVEFKFNQDPGDEKTVALDQTGQTAPRLEPGPGGGIRMKNKLPLYVFASFLSVGLGGCGDTAVDGKQTVLDGLDHVLPAGTIVDMSFDTPAGLEAMVEAYVTSGKADYVDAGFTFEKTEKVDSVGLRLRAPTVAGTGERETKFPLKVNFNYFGGERFHALDKLYLSNNKSDPTLMREQLASRILEGMGVLASRTGYAWVKVNGDVQGLFATVEEVDKRFLRARLGSDAHADDGNLYKCEVPGCDLTWKGDKKSDYLDTTCLEEDGCGLVQKTNEDDVSQNDYADLITFLDVLNNGKDATFEADFGAIFDVDSFLRYLAVAVAIGDFDGYLGSIDNFYLYHRPDTGKWVYIPWEHRKAFGIKGCALATHPTGTGVAAPECTTEKRPLVERVLAVEAWRTKYVAYVKQVAEDYMNVCWVTAGIEELDALIGDKVAADPKSLVTVDAYEVGKGATASADKDMNLLEYVTKRRAFLETEIESLQAEGACDATGVQ